MYYHPQYLLVSPLSSDRVGHGTDGGRAVRTMLSYSANLVYFHSDIVERERSKHVTSWQRGRPFSEYRISIAGKTMPELHTHAVRGQRQRIFNRIRYSNIAPFVYIPNSYNPETSMIQYQSAYDGEHPLLVIKHQSTDLDRLAMRRVLGSGRVEERRVRR